MSLAGREITFSVVDEATESLGRIGDAIDGAQLLPPKPKREIWRLRNGVKVIFRRNPHPERFDLISIQPGNPWSMVIISHGRRYGISHRTRELVPAMREPFQCFENLRAAKREALRVLEQNLVKVSRGDLEELMAATW